MNVRMLQFYVYGRCLNIMLNALEETTLAYVVVTDKSYQFYEPRKCWLLCHRPKSRRNWRQISWLLCSL